MLYYSVWHPVKMVVCFKIDIKYQHSLSLQISSGQGALKEASFKNERKSVIFDRVTLQSCGTTLLRIRLREFLREVVSTG